MKPSRHRKLIIGLYLLALVALVALAWRSLRRVRPSVNFNRIDVAALNSRSARRSLRSHEWPLVPETPQEWRGYLTQEEATLLVPWLVNSPPFQYDPWVYVVGPANRRETMPWPEHPEGEIEVATNSVGLPGTSELAATLPDLRVLVAGDSHTLGVCNAEETFAGRLLGSLGQRNGGKTIEVLNAGFGGYTFHNYVGTLLRWRERSPQVMVVAVFGGNDFAEAMPMLYFLAGDALPEWTPAQLAVCERALGVGNEAMAQALYSAYHIHCMPEGASRSLEAGIAAMQELRAIGKRIGTHLVVCFIPNSCAQPFDPPIEQVDAALAILRDAGFEMAGQTEIEERFVQRLHAEGIECVDMRPIFAAEPSPPFWRHDLHLSLRGHELVAKALEPVVQRLLEP